jgi:hypothetical protein
MIHRRLGVACVLVGFSMSPLACGGDDDDAAVTKADFIEQADAICADFNERGEALGEDLSEDASLEELAALFLEEGIPLLREQIDDLRELDLPEADAEQLEQLWDDLDAGTDELEQQLEDDPQEALSSNFDPFSEANEFATEYGMEECGAS